MSETSITVVVIYSLSFTGTTWLNLLMGCHDDAFALGPADKLWHGRDGCWRGVCRVHGRECTFWEDFKKSLDPDRNFFIQLAERTGRRKIITNNPQPWGIAPQLDERLLQIKRIYLLRDGRAISASYLRKWPERGYLHTVAEWMYGSFVAMEEGAKREDSFSIRYEDLSNDVETYLKAVGEFIGLDYSIDALRYWEREHHLTQGNVGTVASIKMAVNAHMDEFREREYYREKVEKLIKDPSRPFCDERWKAELSRYNRFVFDCYLGETNRRLGYQRDEFTSHESREFSERLDEERLLLRHDDDDVGCVATGNAKVDGAVGRIRRLMGAFSQKIRGG